jgi:hypothetical protein
LRDAVGGLFPLREPGLQFFLRERFDVRQHAGRLSECVRKTKPSGV